VRGLDRIEVEMHGAQVVRVKRTRVLNARAAAASRRSTSTMTL